MINNYLVLRLGSISGDLSIPPKGLLLVTHEPSSVDTAPGPHIRGNTLRAFSEGDREVDLLLPGTARYLISSYFAFLFCFLVEIVTVTALTRLKQTCTDTDIHEMSNM